MVKFWLRDFRGPGDRDLHALPGVYALNALDDDERDRFELHLRGCRACEAEVRGFTATAAALGLASAAEPPPGLKERVMAATAVTRQFPPEVANPPMSASRPPARHPSARRSSLVPRLGLAVGAAGLAAAAVVSVVALRTQDRLNSVQAHAAAITAVLSAPDARIASAPTTAGGRATVVMTAARREMVFTSSGLRPLPSSEVYELWFLGPGAPRRAGIVPAANGGSTAPVLASGLAPGDKIGVTVEPAGGTNAPTTPPIVVLAQ